MAEQTGKTELKFFRKGGKGMLFLFCFLVASVIWIVNALSKTYVTDLKYTVVVSSDKDREAIPVKATLKGQGFALMQVLWKINNAKYPVSAFHNSINCIQLTDSLLGKFRSEISLVNVEPAMLSGKGNPGQKIKKVPVISRINVSFAPQYGSVIPLLLKPVMVEVAGPSSVIDTLKAVYTEEISIADVNDPVFRSVALKNPTSDCWVQPSRVWIYIPSEEFTEATIKIPVLVKNDEQSIKIIPEHVTLKCMVPLKHYNSISPSQFKVELSGNVSNGQEKMSVRVIKKPSFAKNIRTDPAVVSVLILDK
jgi:hypothetical protein